MDQTVNEKLIQGTDKGNGLVEDICQKIKKMLYSHILVPGQKINYQDFSSRLNASITPIIQALKLLQGQNLVRYEINKGYFVGEISEAEVKDFFEARIALETYSIPFVIENWNKENSRAVKEAYNQHVVSARSENIRNFILLRDSQFHLKLVECAGNRVIYNLLKDIFEQIFIRYRPEFLIQRKAREAVNDHMDILVALDKKDENESARFIKEHIKKGMEYMLYCIRSLEVEILE